PLDATAIRGSGSISQSQAQLKRSGSVPLQGAAPGMSGFGATTVRATPPPGAGSRPPSNISVSSSVSADVAEPAPAPPQQQRSNKTMLFALLALIILVGGGISVAAIIRGTAKNQPAVVDVKKAPEPAPTPAPTPAAPEAAAKELARAELPAGATPYEIF